MATKKRPPLRVVPNAKTTVPAREKRTRSNSSDPFVEQCIELMTTGQWIRGLTVRELAKEHGITVDRASELSARASAVIRMSIEGDKEGIRARMLATLDFIIKANAVADGRVAVAAIAEQGKLLGLVDSRPSVAVQVNVQQLAQLDDGTMLQKVEAQIAALTDLRARLMAKQGTPALLPAHIVEMKDD